jgi:mannose-6-phosphate isomerase-like protein (cupin superfamily)
MTPKGDFNLIHSTVPEGQVNRATVHATVSEFWHVLSGRGEIWRRDESGEEGPRYRLHEIAVCLTLPAPNS